MALIDYGAVLIKNGIFINDGLMFMDMEKSVGCKIDGMDGMYFVYAGDKELSQQCEQNKRDNAIKQDRAFAENLAKKLAEV